MDRIALISDIHGNVPALKAVLKDIERRQINRIFCLGDLVGKGPNSDQTVDLIREKCEVVVQGNWDNFIPNPTENSALQWYQNQLGKERLDYLKNLPFSYDFVMSGKQIRIFHASAQSVHHRVLAGHPLEKRLGMFDNTPLTGDIEPDIVGYGDIHYTFIQHLNKKTLFNVGSVGNPLDLTQASYVILEGEYKQQLLTPFSVQFCRVPYDVEHAIALATQKGMPFLEEYTLELRTARYRGAKKS